MQSQVVHAVDFNAAVEQGLNPVAFRRRYLVEGDSWMDRSAIVAGGLPPHLARHIDDGGRGPVLLVSCARFGDTAQRMAQRDLRELQLWLNTDWSWTFDAVLLSAGGNDLIDAALDPAAGAGVLADCRGRSPQDPDECLRAEALCRLMKDIAAAIGTILGTIRRSRRHAGVPVFINLYDCPVPRPAPAIPGGSAWLHPALQKNQVPQALRQPVVDELFDLLQLILGACCWADPAGRIFAVPTGGRLVPADPADSNASGDWLNEIHPSASGWQKLAAVWADSLQAQGCL